MLSYVTWLIHVWHDAFMSAICVVFVTWRTHVQHALFIRDVTHSYVPWLALVIHDPCIWHMWLDAFMPAIDVVYMTLTSTIHVVFMSTIYVAFMTFIFTMYSRDYRHSCLSSTVDIIGVIHAYYVCGIRVYWIYMVFVSMWYLWQIHVFYVCGIRGMTYSCAIWFVHL